MSSTNLLNEYHRSVEQNILRKSSEVIERRKNNPPVPAQASWLFWLTDFCEEAFKLEKGSVDLSIIDRKKLGADIAIRVPSLLKAKPTPKYIAEDVPTFKVALQPLIDQGIVSKIEQKGIYLNLLLTDKALFSELSRSLTLKDRYCESDLLSDRCYAVDYSSPNAAKHLHAGHIRGTIIGHVLSNLYESAGARVFRLNYVNEWGGFGEILEGYSRWSSLADNKLKGNDLLFFVYSTYRNAEKAAGDSSVWKTLYSDSSSALSGAFPNIADHTHFKSEFEIFKAAARERFSRLENGLDPEVSQWKEMVAWSLQDFNRFYDLLDIHQDFVFGESFYVTPGRKLVERGLKEGTVQHFTADHVAAVIAEIDRAEAREEISSEESARFKQEAQDDLGGYVVKIAPFKRIVVQRGDGATIYATRDLAGVEHRLKTFAATDLIYEVGQEQADHFAGLFAASEKMGLFGDKKVRCQHIYHGFYIDAGTKKKLSSREGASSVIKLFEDAIQHFKAKYDDHEDWSDEEKNQVAWRLAIGSVVYNDLRKDKKLPVEINPDRAKMFEEFERSGGAYVMYTVCRGKSILRKAEAIPASDVDSATVELSDIERSLCKLVLDLPRRLAHAAQSDNPAALITAIEELATTYNSYYHDYPVVKGGIRNEHRVVITNAVANALENALRICHVRCPERI